jgi:capsular polysaccharide biosynthesis protein
VNDQDHLVTWFRGDEPPGRLWAYDEAPPGEQPSDADLTGGLVNLGFFRAALRRSAWIWCLSAVLGLLIGSALYVKYPPAYHAAATVLLVDSSSQNPSVEVLTDQSLAQSDAVAARVVRELKLPESVSSFQANYTVTVVTNTVLTLDVGAPSAAAAVQRASALATAFLHYRAQYELIQQQDLFTPLNQQKNAAQQLANQLEAELSSLPSPLLQTPAQKASEESLQNQIAQQQSIVNNVVQTETMAKASTDAMNKGSLVLDPATALKRSKIKGPMLYVAGGLFGGMAAGVFIVVFGALLSCRLRRRDDVALALSAPVRLSVGPVRRRRWPPTLPRQAAKQKLDMKRVVMHLHGAVPGSSHGPASLAVVAVDDARVVARVVVSLADSCAVEGMRIVLADLSGGHLARLLGVSEPGIHRVSHDGATLVVILPDSDEVAPVGPVPSGASPAVPEKASAALISACSGASLLLTLAVLDPAFGGDHLGTWATDAVAVVTAGEASAEKIHGVGEMVRLAGTRLDSAVLLGADKNDESMGLIDQARWSASTDRPSAGRRSRHGAPARPETVGPF